MENLEVLCPNINDEGKTCEQKLLSKFKVCPMCEVKVDPAWFPKGNVYDLFIHSRKQKTLFINTLHFIGSNVFLLFTLSIYNAHKSFVMAFQRQLFSRCSFQTIFMPPLKKGAYCFATVGWYVGRSVGRSVGL